MSAFTDMPGSPITCSEASRPEIRAIITGRDFRWALICRLRLVSGWNWDCAAAGCMPAITTGMVTRRPATYIGRLIRPIISV